ncbi:reverse transcriptase domain-containing protein [Oscillospiraceae bacterium 42-9]
MPVNIYSQHLAAAFSPEWVLEGDIKGCFDHISHQWLIDHILMDKSVLKQFLKAGFVFQGELFPTDEGTPQGGIISPILANMALDGLQQVLSNRFDLSRKGKYSAFVHNKSQVTERIFPPIITNATAGETATHPRKENPMHTRLNTDRSRAFLCLLKIF